MVLPLQSAVTTTPPCRGSSSRLNLNERFCPASRSLALIFNALICAGRNDASGQKCARVAEKSLGLHTKGRFTASFQFIWGEATKSSGCWRNHKQDEPLNTPPLSVSIWCVSLHILINCGSSHCSSKSTYRQIHMIVIKTCKEHWTILGEWWKGAGDIWTDQSYVWSHKMMNPGSSLRGRI